MDILDVLIAKMNELKFLIKFKLRIEFIVVNTILRNLCEKEKRGTIYGNHNLRHKVFIFLRSHYFEHRMSLVHAHKEFKVVSREAHSNFLRRVDAPLYVFSSL